MKNYDDSVKVHHNPNWLYIPDHPYRILIIDGSGPGKTNVLLSLIKNQRPDIDIVYLHVKDPFESKYQLFINGRQEVGIKRLKNPKAFIDYSQTIDDIYEKLKEYFQQRKEKCHWIVSKRKKTQWFTLFHITILFKGLNTIRLNGLITLSQHFQTKGSFKKWYWIIYLKFNLNILWSCVKIILKNHFNF